MKKGQKMSVELKKKISIARKGKGLNNPTSFKKGIIPWIKGKKHSKETLLKMSQNSAHNRYWLGKKRPEIGKKISKAKKGKIGYWKDKKFTNIHRKNLKKARIGKFIGKNNPCWKGGITPLYQQIRTCFKYRQWRSDIFTRDNFTCLKCGDNKGGNLNADHIKKFSDILYQYKIKTLIEALNCEELWNINNGRTLCHNCHKKTDTWGNKKHEKIL